MMPPLRRLARRFGYDLLPLKKARDDHDRLVQILDHLNIDMVVDVGANAGQYASLLRDHGYKRHILSIEPIPYLNTELQGRSAGDKNWSVMEPMAIGDVAGMASLSISKESDMSSLLPQSEFLKNISPSSAIDEHIDVNICRLDELEPLCSASSSRMFVKLDIQGHEPAAIEGAEGLKDQIIGFQIEMALVPVYQGERDYRWMIEQMAELGYDLHLVLPGFFERKLARQLQFDGIFVRRKETADVLC